MKAAEVNAERAMHLRRALEDIRDRGRAWRETHAYFIARAALHDDDIAIEIAEQEAGHCDPEPS